jgi:NAD(P)-dependent dehydrogenase (short-subunit alcohol dehydrogenase family)
VNFKLELHTFEISMTPSTFTAPRDLLADKTVFVSGAGANIGRAVALEAAAQGAAVFFADKNAARCEKLEAELTAMGAKAKGFVADLAFETEIEKLHAQLQKEGISVDTLINNVGVHSEKTTEDAQWWQTWQRVYDTNVLGPCYLTKLIVDAMLKKKAHDSGMRGSVLFLTSIHQTEVRGEAAYSSSKAALGMVVRELAMELARHAIRVNGIAPGYIAEDESGKEIPHRATPLGGTSIPPHYIGRAAVYLCSEYFSNRTTGSILTLDSGLSLHNHLTGSTPNRDGAAASPLRLSPLRLSPLHSLARKFRRTIGPSTP